MSEKRWHLKRGRFLFVVRGPISARLASVLFQHCGFKAYKA